MAEGRTQHCSVKGSQLKGVGVLPAAISEHTSGEGKSKSRKSKRQFLQEYGTNTTQRRRKKKTRGSCTRVVRAAQAAAHSRTIVS